mmetsp:Transcript_109868/g.276417  ORF Transcript_109868/g.276417 Transcript_109868/m.276417 type:complete len:210 (+) Transcript_109868:682-1311(+)
MERRRRRRAGVARHAQVPAANHRCHGWAGADASGATIAAARAPGARRLSLRGRRTARQGMPLRVAEQHLRVTTAAGDHDVVDGAHGAFTGWSLDPGRLPQLVPCSREDEAARMGAGLAPGRAALLADDAARPPRSASGPPTIKWAQRAESYDDGGGCDTGVVSTVLAEHLRACRGGVIARTCPRGFVSGHWGLRQQLRRQWGQHPPSRQ